MKIDFEKVLQDSGMPTTEAAIRAEFDEVVKSENLITNRSKMSPFWRLITALVVKPYLYLKDTLIDHVLINMFLMTAQDWALDMFGAAVNLSRKSESAATGVVIFTKTDINQMIFVKAGTVIQSPPINGHIYQLRTLIDFEIPAGVLSSRISVIAESPGESYNLAAGYYSILVEDIPGIEFITNDDDWIVTPGADTEKADDYRERIRNQYNFVGNYHTDAVYRGIISSITGIATNQIYFVHDAPRGPGTANVYVLLDDGVATNDFISNVNDFIMTKGNHGHGDDLQCFAMPEKPIDIDMTVYFLAEQMPSNIDEYKINMANFIRCAFRQNNDYSVTKVNAYSRFSISNLETELHQVFNEIHSIVINIDDIVSTLDVPRLKSLNINIALSEQIQ
ncbi:baseplate J/gp47 family protein [Orbus wheelerorum]|uniref:baseplate J/gp47 family protein n=1 Tax=Orbus wheelerorum TaxID=3074111 RepID=UPI00370D4354